MSLSYDEQMAASAVAALAGKRGRESFEDAEMKDCKIARFEENEAMKSSSRPKRAPPAPRELLPAPFFYYRDFSTQPDPDPLVPLTAPGRVPNFPAKMHAILSQPDLSGIVTWQPNGRSWRVLKPREFEIKILPRFFEHSKFSSFVRQANGWGFRRITQGPDRNSYYHEKFLRGLPHLAKDMKRPGVAEKKTADPEHEPDLYKISELHPLPTTASGDDFNLLHATLQGGPKARVPIYSGFLGSYAGSSGAQATELPPRDQFVLEAFQQSIAASEDQFRGFSTRPATSTVRQPSSPLPSYMTAGSSASSLAASRNLLACDRLSALAVANQLSFRAAPPCHSTNLSAAFNASSAASQFAAGFAAATAYSQQQFRNILGNLAQQNNSNNGFHGLR